MRISPQPNLPTIRPSRPPLSRPTKHVSFSKLTLVFRCAPISPRTVTTICPLRSSLLVLFDVQVALYTARSPSPTLPSCLLEVSSIKSPMEGLFLLTWNLPPYLLPTQRAFLRIFLLCIELDPSDSTVVNGKKSSPLFTFPPPLVHKEFLLPPRVLILRSASFFHDSPLSDSSVELSNLPLRPSSDLDELSFPHPIASHSAFLLRIPSTHRSGPCGVSFPVYPLSLSRAFLQEGIPIDVFVRLSSGLSLFSIEEGSVFPYAFSAVPTPPGVDEPMFLPPSTLSLFLYTSSSNESFFFFLRTSSRITLFSLFFLLLFPSLLILRDFFSEIFPSSLFTGQCFRTSLAGLP